MQMAEVLYSHGIYLNKKSQRQKERSQLLNTMDGSPCVAFQWQPDKKVPLFKIFLQKE